MYPKSLLVSLATVLAVIAIQALYLKSLPGSLVRVYYAHDCGEFNKAPAADMTALYDGYVFDYRIPLSMTAEDMVEIKHMVGDRKQADMTVLIHMAAWVRTKMTFGRSGETAITGSADALQSPSSRGTYRGLCDRYARNFAAACQSAGIPARVIELNGHVVPEAFLRESGRWIMVDPTLGYYISSDGVPLSVAEIINAYRKGKQTHAAVFAAERGDDSIYRPADESSLKEIYLNGFTVVSNQHLEATQILSYIAGSLSLPIAKLQYLDGNSVKIGRKEDILRKILAVNATVLFLLAAIAALKPLRRRANLLNRDAGK